MLARGKVSVDARAWMEGAVEGVGKLPEVDAAEIGWATATTGWVSPPLCS